MGKRFDHAYRECQIEGGSLFEIVEPGFSGGQAFLCFFYPARRSNILPETVETKTEKLLLPSSMRG